jgi:predicted esterase
VKRNQFPALLVCVLFAVAGHATDAVSRSVHCENADYQYLLYSEAHTAPAPAVLLLHGAGDHAANFIDTWTHQAHKKNMVLITPEIPREIKFEAVAPAVFHCMVEDAKQHAAIDPQRIYLFGHSMGGYLGFDTAMYQSEYFAAAAIHGSDIADDYVSILKQAKRKIPLAIYIGDSDQYSPLAHVRKTIELLNKDGFPVHYMEIAGHGHNYYEISEQVNKDAWKFFEQQTLPAK